MFHSVHKEINLMIIGAVVFMCFSSNSASTKNHYFAHDTQVDRYGVIAPWYNQQNGQLDFRVRIAAETLKRYPWTDSNIQIPAPNFMYSGHWAIDSDGLITAKVTGDSDYGDLIDNSAYSIGGYINYYAYSGDPSVLGLAAIHAKIILNLCQTDANNPWPNFLIGVPTRGAAYGKCSSDGFMQLDLAAFAAYELLRLYQVTGNTEYFEAAKHWGDVLAEKRNQNPGEDPWERYANPEVTPWPNEKRMTGGVAMLLTFFDELIKLGYYGVNSEILLARQAGENYLKNVLLSVWFNVDTWGRNFWDGPHLGQGDNINAFVVKYMMRHSDVFPNWRIDSRNILTLIFNRNSALEAAQADAYNGAWAYPEAQGCCGASLAYTIQEIAPVWAEYASRTGDNWAKEIARRMMILSTYDATETGAWKDGINGELLISEGWFKIAHPLALREVTAAIGWMPDFFAPARENHLVRSTGVIWSIEYGKGQIEYFETVLPKSSEGLDLLEDVLRLSFDPKQIYADNTLLIEKLEFSSTDDLGFKKEKLKNGDYIVTVRHTGLGRVRIYGNDDLQKIANADQFSVVGNWRLQPRGNDVDLITNQTGATATFEFEGNQIRVIGNVAGDGGIADIYLDGVKQLVGIDFWNFTPRFDEVLYYNSGLPSGIHTLKIVSTGKKNYYSENYFIRISGVQFSNQYSPSSTHAIKPATFPPQRMVFGYAGREPITSKSGSLWLPGTEVITRGLSHFDTVKSSWWTQPSTGIIYGPDSSQLYQYGIHAPLIIINLTTNPGLHRLILKFSANSHVNLSTMNEMDISINGESKVNNFNVSTTAGGRNRQYDLVFEDLQPKNGIIEIQLDSRHYNKEAFIQALELVNIN